MHQSDNKWHAYNVADVMTLGSSEWRIIRQLPSFNFTKQPIFERGFLYWLSHSNHIPQQLIAFNVESEVFSTIDTPSHVDLIVDLGGYLGLVYAGSKSLIVWFGTGHNAHGQIIEWGERGTITIVHEGKCINPSELVS
ncbi:hypothetical protein PanWU01x14_152110 [Parasponia andersonii]|uniref:F-box associated beta-propeller type 3 domain-containing protein n=1 Tax=Parasponia andersonii TaxID=3476 RepID=A0A2P5CHR7_PARAD|nr:hypothetical protein PanWU01x14_152110 [Parasponia andersonii]